MLLNFLFFNVVHFALSIFGALVFFSAGWLYLDSWNVARKNKTPLFRCLGFFLLALVSIAHATSIEDPQIETVRELAKIMGLGFILLSLFVEPILDPPKKPQSQTLAILPISLSFVSSALTPVSGVLYLLVALMYWFKTGAGYEKQLRPAFFAFLFLALGEFTKITTIWQDTAIVFWSNILTKFGPVWILQHTFETIGVIILAIWIWGYTRFRLQVQLFIISVSLSLIIFLATAVLFSFLLLKNIEADALSHLKTDLNVLQYTIERLGQEAQASSRVLTKDSDFRRAFATTDKESLYNITQDFMVNTNLSFLQISSLSGEILARAEDKEKIGDTVAEDPLVKSALANIPLSTIVTQEGITSPEVQVKTAVPILDTSTGSVLGVVITGMTLDNAFVDGVKKVTGLDTSVFGDNKRAATTFLAPDGTSRLLGTLETDEEIIKTVLEQGKTFTGANQVLNQPFYSAYAPLKTVDDKTVGMLYIGKLQTTLFAAAEKSIQLTFLGSVLLILLSLIPAYFISRFIKEQMEA